MSSDANVNILEEIEVVTISLTEEALEVEVSSVFRQETVLQRGSAPGAFLISLKHVNGNESVSLSVSNLKFSYEELPHHEKCLFRFQKLY